MKCIEVCGILVPSLCYIKAGSIEDEAFRQ